jgi:hypothetical protein
MGTHFRSTILLIAALAAAGDVPRVSPFAPPAPITALPDTRAATALPAIPATTPQGEAMPQNSDTAPTGPPAPTTPQPASAGTSSRTLQGSSRVEIIRTVDGEFAKTARPLPGKTDGFILFVGKPIDEQKMSDALRLQGMAIPAGEPVQITQMDFETRRIVVQINGGAKKRFHLLDHLSVGGADPPAQPVDRHEGLGAVIVLDYGHALPDMTPEAVKQALAPLLDFSKEHSSTVNWVDTLPPEFQEAIRDHKALPGMDQETVIAAIGRPDKKVRERNSQGVETEDWIYGNPPARTVFVTFLGDKVSKVEEFN